MTEHVLAVGPLAFRDQRLLIGVFEEHRTHQWDSVVRGLLHAGVNVRKQPVALFNVAPANGFMLGTMHPRFLVGGSFFGMVAIDGIEGAQFQPFGEQIGLRAAFVSADVGSHNGKAAQSQILQHGD